MSDLVGNPEDRFSDVAAQLKAKSFQASTISILEQNRIEQKLYYTPAYIV